MGVIMRGGVPYGSFDRNNLEIITTPLEEVEDKKEDLIYVVKDNIDAAEGEAWCWDGEKAIRIGKAGGGSIELDIDQDMIPVGDGEGNLKNSGIKFYNYKEIQEKTTNVGARDSAGMGRKNWANDIAPLYFVYPYYHQNKREGQLNHFNITIKKGEINNTYDITTEYVDASHFKITVNGNSDVVETGNMFRIKYIENPTTANNVVIGTQNLYQNALQCSISLNLETFSTATTELLNEDIEITINEIDYHTYDSIHKPFFGMGEPGSKRDNPEPDFALKIEDLPLLQESITKFDPSSYSSYKDFNIYLNPIVDNTIIYKNATSIEGTPVTEEIVKVDENVLQFSKDLPIKIMGGDRTNNIVNQELYMDGNSHLILQGLDSTNPNEDRLDIIGRGRGLVYFNDDSFVVPDRYTFTRTFSRTYNRTTETIVDIALKSQDETILKDIVNNETTQTPFTYSSYFRTKNSDIVKSGKYSQQSIEGSYKIADDAATYTIFAEVTYLTASSLWNTRQPARQTWFLSDNFIHKKPGPVIRMEDNVEVNFNGNAHFRMAEESYVNIQGAPQILVESNPRILIGSTDNKFQEVYIPRKHDESNDEKDVKITINIKGSSDIVMDHYATIQMFGSSYVNLDHFAELNMLGESMIRTNGMSGIYLTDDAYNFKGSTSAMTSPTITKCCLSPTIQATPNQVIIGSIGCGSGKTYTDHLSGNRNKLILIYNRLDKNHSTPLNKSELLSLSSSASGLYYKYRESINPTIQNNDKILRLRTLENSLSTLAYSLPDDTSTITIPTEDINDVLECIQAYLTPVLLYENSTFMSIGGLKGHVDINIKPEEYEHVQLFMHNNSFIHHSGNSHQELHDNSRLIMRGHCDKPWLVGSEYNDELTGGKWTSPIQNANGPLVGMYGAPTLIMREEWNIAKETQKTYETTPKTISREGNEIEVAKTYDIPMSSIQSASPELYDLLKAIMENKIKLTYGINSRYYGDGRIVKYNYDTTNNNFQFAISDFSFYSQSYSGTQKVNYGSQRMETSIPAWKGSNMSLEKFINEFQIPFSALQENLQNLFIETYGERPEYIGGYEDTYLTKNSAYNGEILLKQVKIEQVLPELDGWTPETNKVEGNPFVELIGDADLRMDKNGITINGVNFTNNQLEALKELL